MKKFVVIGLLFAIFLFKAPVKAQDSLTDLISQNSQFSLTPEFSLVPHKQNPAKLGASLFNPYYFDRSHYVEIYDALPKVLNNEDIKKYHAIYTAQKQKDFKTADAIIKTLNNDILLPYLYYLRYTNKGYKPTYKELKNWLDKYSDTAVASSVYSMAKALPMNKKSLKAPNSFYESFLPIYVRHDLFEDVVPTLKPVTNNNVNIVKNATTAKITAFLKKGKTLNAKNLLLERKTINSLDKNTYDYYASVLAKSYFLDGEYPQAIVWGKKAIKRNPKLIPEASFTLALSYYSLKEYKQASEYFYYLSKNSNYFTSDIIAKGAYWYARVNLELGNLDNYYAGLKVAAKYVYNFYGILASEELGVKPQYVWNYLTFPEESVEFLLDSVYGQRAFALLQFGLGDWAEQELTFLATYDSARRNKKDENKLLNGLIYMAQSVPMPALSFKLAGPQGIYYGLSHLSYPVFFIDLEDGYSVDPALLLAVMRKESLFFSGAQSSPGAMGLMQIMPATASKVVEQYKVPYDNKYALNIPRTNISLGQKYINTLLTNKDSEANLIYVLAGYNGGFHNVRNWKAAEHRSAKDPLFFIESIPFYETRNYVKSVMTDYWIYQIKMGIQPHALSSLAQGGQPIYYNIDADQIDSLKSFSYLLSKSISSNIPKT